MVICTLSGALTVDDGHGGMELAPHQSAVIPAVCGHATGRAGAAGALLVVAW